MREVGNVFHFRDFRDCITRAGCELIYIFMEDCRYGSTERKEKLFTQENR